MSGEFFFVNFYFKCFYFPKTVPIFFYKIYSNVGKAQKSVLSWIRLPGPVSSHHNLFI